MNSKKRKNWDFYKIRVRKKFWRNLVQPSPLKNNSTFLERIEHRLYSINSKVCANLYVFTNNPTRMRDVLLQ